MLKSTFLKLIDKYSENKELSLILWTEIETHYGEKSRHYHTLSHLEHMLSLLHSVQEKFENFDTVLFALYYHDIIYSATAKNNEEKSADLARKRMLLIPIPEVQFERCVTHILATKTHEKSLDQDSELFTNIDLSILGQKWEVYSIYLQNVRKEYSVFPDFLYNPGRKKVLEHFLSMPQIFKTELFRPKFEKQAIENMRKELTLL